MRRFFFALGQLQLVSQNYLTYLLGMAWKERLSKNSLFIFFISCVLFSTAQASTPLWTIVPSSGSNPTLTVAENGTANVQYNVQNQSHKSKRLTMLALPGINQTTPCILAPKGQPGSSCVLNLSITGSTLPREGIHHGPVLCQTNSDGSPIPNQCYQPSAANSLNITRGSATGAVINVNPSSLNFIAGANATFTITNSSSSSEPAKNVNVVIPSGSSITVQNNTCGANLAVGTSCSITLTASATEGPTLIGVSGSNTNSSQVTVTVTPVPVSNISVSPTVLVFTQNTPGVLTIFNDSSSTVPALNVTAISPPGSNIMVSNNTCNSSIAVGASCTITLTSTTAEGPTSISISGDNTNTVAVMVTVTTNPTALLSVSPSSLMFTAGETGTINVTNSSGSAVTADAVGSTIPVSSSITEQSNTCLPSLAIGATCSITYTSSTVEGPTNIIVSGNNTNTENVAVTVTSQPTATISVSPSSLTFEAGANGTLTVTNNNLSPVNATNITASIPIGSNITVLNNGCTGPLAPGANCLIVLTSPVSAPTTSVTVSGSNTNSSMATITVEPTCAPITSQSTPGVSVSFTGTVTNLGNLIDSNLNNFATMNISLLSGASIIMDIPSTSYTKIGVKMATAGVITLSSFTFTAFNGVTPVYTTTVFPSNTSMEYSFILPGTLLMNRITLSTIPASVVSSYNVNYFCAGQ
ncbi:autotransporter outer membrane beta-barrel domain-containing protein [Legionella saoudiensis]|uniref:hypothetical protein n=1 Tax=Legionella saoudiensis TaxID=1750561 RepID=UPI0007303054|nr:hypothetical protein [Legionella saoudiensis]